MIAKAYADRSEAEPEIDHDLETEVQAVAAFFEALSPELQRYLDREAEIGRQAYGQA